MTDKEKIREEVERLRSLHQMKYQELDADSSMSLVECGKRNLCNELLSFIDSLQEEHVSNPTPNEKMSVERWKNACDAACCDMNYRSHYGLTETRDDYFVDGVQWADEHPKEEPVSIWHDASEKPKRDDLLIETNDGRIIHRQSINNYGMVKRWAYTSDLLNLDNSCNFGNNLQEEPVGDDLGEYINELSKQFPEVSFAKLSRIAVKIAKWQEKQDQKTIELAENHAMLAGMNKMEQQMMAKAIDAQCFGFQGAALFSFRLPADNYLVGSEVKVIVIKK